MPVDEAARSCLILSYNRVPVGDCRLVEGGGLRVWGLANGLAQNGITVGIGIHDSLDQSEGMHDGLAVRRWSVATINALAKQYDSVIMSFWLGEPGRIVSELGGAVQLILDGYVPIYVEYPAIIATQREGEYVAYLRRLPRWNAALARGDYLLCASPIQKDFYMGVLSAVGRINPVTYGHQFIEVVPFGIDSSDPAPGKQPEVVGIQDDDFVVLWFGGLYPWFDLRKLLDAVHELHCERKPIKLVVVGGRNPFNARPEFTRQYESLIAYAREKGALGTSSFFIDWVEYAKRAEWYAMANVAVSLNAQGEEARLAWRTRMMDLVWGGVPIATNGGDPLSEYLIAHGAAIKLGDASEGALKAEIESLYADPARLRAAQAALKPLRPKFYWEVITRRLADVIRAGKRAPDLLAEQAMRAGARAVRRDKRRDRARSIAPRWTLRTVNVARKRAGK